MSRHDGIALRRDIVGSIYSLATQPDRMTVAAGIGSPTGGAFLSVLSRFLGRRLARSRLRQRRRGPDEVPGRSFMIYLTGNAPAGGLKVAYFVLN
jgi:hypothetical protein